MKKTLLITVIFTFVMNFTFLNAQNVTIPDVNFKNALLNHNPIIDINGDGEIQISEASAYSGKMQVSGMAISDLSGI